MKSDGNPPVNVRRLRIDETSEPLLSNSRAAGEGIRRKTEREAVDIPSGRREDTPVHLNWRVSYSNGRIPPQACCCARRPCRRRVLALPPSTATASLHRHACIPTSHQRKPSKVLPDHRYIYYLCANYWQYQDEAPGETVAARPEYSPKKLTLTLSHLLKRRGLRTFCAKRPPENRPEKPHLEPSEGIRSPRKIAPEKPHLCRSRMKYSIISVT